MKKYYGHTLLYLHETIALGSARSDRFLEVFGEVYQPMMSDLGARLFAIWESTPYNGHWPQVTMIWEIDAFADYARIGKAQARGGSHAEAAAQWSAFLAEHGATGEGRIMYAGRNNKTLAELRQANFGAGLVIQEIMQTKPGRQDDYIRELERLYVPWSERTGMRWLGSLITTFRFNEVIHYWALDGDWDCFANHYPSWKDSPPTEIVTWMSVAPALRDGVGGLDPASSAAVAPSMKVSPRSPVMSSLSYDPFDPAVMADPLPYYRTLRDDHPMYYLEKWDTYALSRFADIWEVLEVNDGTFVASEGTLPAATVLARHNDGPVPDPPLHPMPFHANFDAPIYDAVRRCTSGQFRPKSVTKLGDRIRELANQRLDDLLPRGSFDLTQDYGGIVAASVVCELVGLPTDLAPEVLAAVNAGSLAQPGSGVEVANARPGYLEYLVPIVQARRNGLTGGELPIVDNLIGYRLPDESALSDVEAAVQMLGVFIGGTETVPKIVAHGLWELGRRPAQMAAVRTDPTANVPVAREEMIRFCAPAQWFARTVRKPFTMHATTVEPGQRIITLLGSASRDEREYPNAEDFVWNRPIERLLAFGRGQHFCLGVHLARLEIAIMVTEWLKRVTDFRIDEEAALRPPSSFQWGWNNVPVEV